MITQGEINELQKHISDLQTKLDLLAAARNGERESRANAFERQFNRTYDGISKVLSTTMDERRNMAMQMLFKKMQTVTGFSKEYLVQTSKDRHRVLVEPRQIMVSLHNILFDETLENSARIFSMNHATILHCKKTVSALMKTDANFRKKYAPVFIAAKNIDSRKIRNHFGI